MFKNKQRKETEANDKLQKDVNCLKDSVTEILTRLDKVEFITAGPLGKLKQYDKQGNKG